MTPGVAKEDFLPSHLRTSWDILKTRDIADRAENIDLSPVAAVTPPASPRFAQPSPSPNTPSKVSSSEEAAQAAKSTNGSRFVVH
jgi:hypothetical protein